MEGAVQNESKLVGSLSTGASVRGGVGTGSSLRGGVGTVFGKDGKSAYEVAVKNGFEGSETEWLESLIGKQGLKGEDGYTPIKGVDYFDGKDGYTPVKGVDYFDGENGKDGYTPQKGIDYFDGKDGYTPVKGVDYFDGKDGYTPIKGVDYFDGEDGADGKDGHTPVRGVDYYTEDDKQAILADAVPAATQAVVHIGDTAPTDPNTKVWIKTNGTPDVAVMCSPQELTDEQKAQARANIGIDELLDNILGNLSANTAIDLANAPEVESLENLPDDSPVAVKYDGEIYLKVEE